MVWSPGGAAGSCTARGAGPGRDGGGSRAPSCTGTGTRRVRPTSSRRRRAAGTRSSGRPAVAPTSSVPGRAASPSGPPSGREGRLTPTSSAVESPGRRGALQRGGTHPSATSSWSGGGAGRVRRRGLGASGRRRSPETFRTRTVHSSTARPSTCIDADATGAPRLPYASSVRPPPPPSGPRRGLPRPRNHPTILSSPGTPVD